jgi:3-deoxy-D-manno-octulosonic-acid transferase
MLKRILRGRIAQHVTEHLVGLYLGAVLYTSRWKIEADPATWALLTRQRQAVIIVFWHEYLPLVPVLWWRARRDNPSLSLNALISRHRDGRMIAAIMRRWGIASVDGSSAKTGKIAKGGAAALRSLLGLLREGKVVALTPDGPRGPRRAIQPGAALLAAISGAPVVPIAATCRPAWRIKSWDRMMLPLPFSRVTILCGMAIAIERRDREAGSAILAHALEALDRRPPSS